LVITGENSHQVYSFVTFLHSKIEKLAFPLFLYYVFHYEQCQSSTCERKILFVFQKIFKNIFPGLAGTLATSVTYLNNPETTPRPRLFLMDNEAARTGALTHFAATGEKIVCIFKAFIKQWKKKGGMAESKNSKNRGVSHKLYDEREFFNRLLTRDKNA